MKKMAMIAGISGQLGPIWKETLQEMGYWIAWMDSVQKPVVDISDRERVVGVARKLMQIRGTAPTVLVLNASIDNPPGSEALFHGNLERIIRVNLIGICNVVEAFLPAMIKNGGGTIIGIGSIQGFIAADYRNYEGAFEKPVAYNLSKAALMQYVKSLTVQYGRHGIRACCIAFGPYDGGKLSPVFLDKFLKNVPLGRPISKQSVKAAMRFAVECPEFAGQTALIDGGYTSW